MWNPFVIAVKGERKRVKTNTWLAMTSEGREGNRVTIDEPRELAGTGAERYRSEETYS